MFINNRAIEKYTIKKRILSISYASKTTDRFSNVPPRTTRCSREFGGRLVAGESRPTSWQTLSNSPTHVSVRVFDSYDRTKPKGEAKKKKQRGRERKIVEKEKRGKRNESEERVKGILCVPVNLLAPVVLAVHDVGSLSIPIRSAVPWSE